MAKFKPPKELVILGQKCTLEDLGVKYRLKAEGSNVDSTTYSPRVYCYYTSYAEPLYVPKHVLEDAVQDAIEQKPIPKIR